jgi:DNA-binding GntR family transcriptional regulator
MQVEPIKAQGLEDSVYRSIKGMIVSLRLRPTELLNINALATMLEVSITPVRAALHLLEGENLVRRVQNKGFYVTNLTKTDAEYLYEIRRSLEVLAIEHAIENIDRRELETLIKGMKALKEDKKKKQKIQPYDLDYSLHDMIISSCGNPYLQNTFSGLISNIQRYRNVIRQVSLPDDDAWIQSELDEHIQIGEYILAKDLENATATMYKHISRLINVVEERLAHVSLPAESEEE